MSSKFSEDPVIDAAYVFLETLNITLADVLTNHPDLKAHLLSAIQHNLPTNEERLNDNFYKNRAGILRGFLAHLQVALFPQEL